MFMPVHTSFSNSYQRNTTNMADIYRKIKTGCSGHLNVSPSAFPTSLMDSVTGSYIKPLKQLQVEKIRINLHTQSITMIFFRQ